MLKLLRFHDIKAAGIVNNRVTLAEWVEKHNFPPGRYLGPNTRVWTEQEISDWLASRPIAVSTSEAA